MLSKSKLRRIRERALTIADDDIRLADLITPFVAGLVLTMSANCLFMFITECIIEVLMVFNWMPKIPFRLDFFALTALSALLGWQTLRGTKQSHMDVTSNTLWVAAAVESFLIFGDIVFMLEYGWEYDLVIPIRLPFLILTLINLCIVFYLYVILHAIHPKSWCWGGADVEGIEMDYERGTTLENDMGQKVDLELGMKVKEAIDHMNEDENENGMHPPDMGTGVGMGMPEMCPEADHEAEIVNVQTLTVTIKELPSNSSSSSLISRSSSAGRTGTGAGAGTVLGGEGEGNEANGSCGDSCGDLKGKDPSILPLSMFHLPKALSQLSFKKLPSDDDGENVVV